MTKSVVAALAIMLSAGVAFAQTKKAPPRKHRPAPPSPPAEAPAKEAAPALLAPLPEAPAPAGGPLRTDEKAGEKLEKGRSADVNLSADDERLAAVAFRQGNDQLNNGLFPQAVQQYRAALSHWDHPAIHYNLALALINLDQPIEVFDELNKAIAYGEEPLEKDKYDHAKDYLKLVMGQLADVEVSCDKYGAKVSVDGKEAFVAPGKFAAKVRVGQHTFVAEKEGYNARITAPFIGPGDHFRIELKLYTAEELTRYRRKWERGWVPYAVIGAGALVGIAGGVLQLSAQSDYNAFNAAVASCQTATAGCSSSTPGIMSLKDSGDTKRVLGFVGYGVAGAAIATGAVLAWLNRREAYQITADELGRERVSATVAPIVSPGAVGAVVSGRF